MLLARWKLIFLKKKWINYNFSGIFYEKRATLLSASIPKYVSGIHGCTVQAFPGATKGKLPELVSSGRVNLSSVDFAIINVGTNNVSSSQSVNTILSYYGALSYELKRITRAK